MERTDYYFIDADGNHCQLSTCNLDHKAKIDAHILKHAKAKDKSIKDKDKVKGKKHVLVKGKVVEQDQDFYAIDEPFELRESNDLVL